MKGWSFYDNKFVDCDKIKETWRIVMIMIGRLRININTKHNLSIASQII
jgi:hypothetical protein